MAGTVIDALIVELSLDPAKFTKGQQQAMAAAKKLEDQVERSGKNVEDNAAKMGDAIGGIKRQALELFAVFAGGKTAIGFARDLTQANAQLGRLERNIGISASEISKWQGAARIFGGDAQSMAQSFTTISDAFAGWKIGVVSPLIADLRAISTAGGKIIDVNKGVEQSFLDLSTNLKAIHDRDPAQAGLLGRRLGIDPALFDLLIQGPTALQKVLDYVNKIGTSTKGDIDAFGELEKRISQMGLKAESLGRKALGDGPNGEEGAASKVIQLADVLNLTPGEIWNNLTTTGTWLGKKPAKLFPNAGGMDTTGGFTSQDEKEAFIRSEAAKRGINPNVAMAVAKSEGFNSFSGDNGTSFGAFQLHVTPGGRGRAVGDQFRTATGKDPSDPANERAAIAFALDDARKNGWTAYHGAANTGIGQWQGIDRAAGGGNSTVDVKINNVNVTAPSGSDPTDFANRFSDAVKRVSFASQATNGQN